MFDTLISYVPRAVKYVPRVWKAVAAAAGAGATAYGGYAEGGVLFEEWVRIVAGAVAVGVAVWYKRNAT